MSRIDGAAPGIPADVLDQCPITGAVTRTPLSAFRYKKTHRFRRRRGQQAAGCMVLPDGLDDRLIDGHGQAPAGLAAAERAPSAIGDVITDPDCDGDLIRETDEPGIVLVIGRAGLARDIGCERANPARSAALN